MFNPLFVFGLPILQGKAEIEGRGSLPGGKSVLLAPDGGLESWGSSRGNVFPSRHFTEQMKASGRGSKRPASTSAVSRTRRGWAGAGNEVKC